MLRPLPPSSRFLPHRRNEESLFSAGLKVNPWNVKLLNNMARIEESRHNVEAAITYYRTALQIESQSLRTFMNLGNLYSRLGKLREAESVFLKVCHVFLPFPFRFQSPLSSFPSNNCVPDCLTACRISGSESFAQEEKLT